MTFGGQSRQMARGGTENRVAVAVPGSGLTLGVADQRVVFRAVEVQAA